MITVSSAIKKEHYARRAQRKILKASVSWNNERIPQIQEEDTTRCSQRGSNGIQLLPIIEVERTYKI
jgi:hypothetical protein